MANALDVPPRPEGYVTDKAGLLDLNTRIKLENVLSKYEAKTSNQIFVVIFPSLEGASLEDFSIRLAEKWKPGQASKDNGAILLIFKNDRKIRIEVGYGLEGSLTDATAFQIIQNQISPYFKQGRYADGILNGVASIMKAIHGQYSNERSALTRNAINREYSQRAYNVRVHLDEKLLRTILYYVIGILFLLFIITSIVDVKRYKSYLYQHRIFKNLEPFPEWWIHNSSFLAILWGTFKLVLEILYYLFIFSMLRGGGSGISSRGGRSGGFSGGGGGRFGGGGASGGW